MERLENPLLFLRNLEQIEWTVSNGISGEYSRKVKDRLLEDDIHIEYIKLINIVNDDHNDQEFLIFNREIREKASAKHTRNY